MKKVIKGKVYDTETATRIAEWEPGIAAGDFDWYCEELYRKRTGEYFIWGEGHASSKYAVHSYGTWAHGEAITPLSYEDARTWAEEHLDADAYMAEFGAVDEDGDKRKMLVEVSEAAHRRVREYAAGNGVNFSEAVERLILGE